MAKIPTPKRFKGKILGLAFNVYKNGWNDSKRGIHPSSVKSTAPDKDYMFYSEWLQGYKDFTAQNLENSHNLKLDV